MVSYFAHSFKDKPVEDWQLLEEHLQKVAALSLEIHLREHALFASKISGGIDYCKSQVSKSSIYRVVE